MHSIASNTSSVSRWHERWFFYSFVLFYCTAALHNLHKISCEQLDLYNQLPGFVSQKLACFSAQLRFVVVVCAFNFMRFIIYFLRLVLCRNGILLFFSLRRLFAI